MRAARLAAGAFLVAVGACAPTPPSENLLAVRPATGSANWPARESLVTLTPRPDVSLDTLILRPAGEPVGGVVVLTGGDGKLNLRIRPPGWLGGNFLVRSRMRFAAEGYVVATVDSPSDQPNGMGGFRLGTDHVADLAAVVARLRWETKGPIWLIGTSMGTVSAASAGRPGAAGADGLVLTSTVTRGSGTHPFSTVDVSLEDIAVPVLIFHHQSDGCAFSPWSGTEILSKRLGKAGRVEVITVAGGDSPRSVPCEAYSAHGFLGIEAPSVTLMTNWMKAAIR